jgi:hypothetical protein
VAQATAEPLVLVTVDPEITRYRALLLFVP